MNQFTNLCKLAGIYIAEFIGYLSACSARHIICMTRSIRWMVDCHIVPGEASA